MSSWSSIATHVIPPIFFISITLYAAYSLMLSNRRTAKNAKLAEESVALEREINAKTARAVELLESILEQLRRD